MNILIKNIFDVVNCFRANVFKIKSNTMLEFRVSWYYTIIAFVWGRCKVISTWEKYIDWGRSPRSIYFSQVDITLHWPNTKATIVILLIWIFFKYVVPLSWLYVYFSEYRFTLYMFIDKSKIFNCKYNLKKSFKTLKCSEIN